MDHRPLKREVASCLVDHGTSRANTLYSTLTAGVSLGLPVHHPYTLEGDEVPCLGSTSQHHGMSLLLSEAWLLSKYIFVLFQFILLLCLSTQDLTFHNLSSPSLPLLLRQNR